MGVISINMPLRGLKFNGDTDLTVDNQEVKADPEEGLGTCCLEEEMVDSNWIVFALSK